ncbi:MAG: DUF2997 domain-containing protein [Zetaproteobacteria bacterium]|nr:DUF2997 domain-containing protein [Zetaproteobacteria bacterium]
MKEYNVIVEIDEDGNIKAETKGMNGKVCINELDEILDEVTGEREFKNKPEFYKKDSVVRKTIKNKQ